MSEICETDNINDNDDNDNNNATADDDINNTKKIRKKILKRNRKSKIPYECISCGYKTQKKTDMHAHLYKLKKQCPCTENDIILTDEIKEYILKNRRYVIPKPEISNVKKDKITEIKKEYDEKVKKLTKEFNDKLISEIKDYVDEDANYIYLIKPQANVFNKDNILKLGRSILKEKIVNIARITGYGIGSEIILVAKCMNCVKLEMIIKKKFKEIFIQPYGEESFIGDEEKMKNIIMDAVKNEKDTDKQLIKRRYSDSDLLVM